MDNYHHHARLTIIRREELARKAPAPTKVACHSPRHTFGVTHYDIAQRR
jgi:hypothetical protein